MTEDKKKLRALLEGLQAEMIDKALKEWTVKNYRDYGKLYYKTVIDMVKKENSKTKNQIPNRMRISKLKEDHPLIYDSLQDQRGDEGDDGWVATAINWAATKESYFFWEAVDDGDFATAYEICPHLKPKTK